MPWLYHNQSKYSVCCHLKVDVDSINSDWSIKPGCLNGCKQDRFLMKRQTHLKCIPWKCLHSIQSVEFQTLQGVIMSAGIKDTSCLKQFSAPPQARRYYSPGASCDSKCINHRAGRLSAMMTLIINTADRWP